MEDIKNGGPATKIKESRYLRVGKYEVIGNIQQHPELISGEKG